MYLTVMQFYDRNDDECVCLMNDNQDIVLVNVSNAEFTYITPMGDLTTVVEMINFADGNLLHVPQDNEHSFKEWVGMNAEELGGDLVYQLLTNVSYE